MLPCFRLILYFTIERRCWAELIRTPDINSTFFITSYILSLIMKRSTGVLNFSI